MAGGGRDRRERALDSLAGLAVGDALGSQFFMRGYGAELAVTRSMPRPPWRWTDDTAMACTLVQVLLRYGCVDQDTLAAGFAERFDRPRGYGPAMNRLLREIGAGIPWRTAAPALFDGKGSFGNGAAMRVAPLGAYFADDLDVVVTEAALSAEVTHAHPDAAAGAVAIAVAAALAAEHRSDPDDLDVVVTFIEGVGERTPAGPVQDGIRRASAIDARRSIGSVALELGNGSRVSAADTVPFAVWGAATNMSDYEAAILTCIEAGGDVDTTSAMVGGIVAAHLGREAVPERWRAATEPVPAWVGR